VPSEALRQHRSILQPEATHRDASTGDAGFAVPQVWFSREEHGCVIVCLFVRPLACLLVCLFVCLLVDSFILFIYIRWPQQTAKGYASGNRGCGHHRHRRHNNNNKLRGGDGFFPKILGMVLPKKYGKRIAFDTNDRQMHIILSILDGSKTPRTPKTVHKVVLIVMLIRFWYHR
jgi:hypothetical protein